MSLVKKTVQKSLAYLVFTYDEENCGESSFSDGLDQFEIGAWRRKLRQKLIKTFGPGTRLGRS